MTQSLFRDQVYVKRGTKLSITPSQSQVGVPQGDPASPIYFTIYLDRVLRIALSAMRGVNLIDDSGRAWSLTLQAYADDLVLFAATLSVGRAISTSSLKL